MPPNGWNEWSVHVKEELKRLNTCYEGMRDTLNQVRIDIATLKVKAGIWGGIGALIPIIGAVLIWAIKEHLSK